MLFLRLQVLGVAQAAVTECWQWKEENPTKICVFFSYKNKNSDISSSCAKNIGGNKFSASEVSPKWVKRKSWRKERREKDWKMVITMASYALQMPGLGGARKAAWAKSQWK